VHDALLLLLLLLLLLRQVDDKVFRSCLEPTLAVAGFEGRFKSKCGLMREGEALFVRRSRCSILESFDMDLKDAFKAPDCPFKVRPSAPQGAQAAPSRLLTCVVAPDSLLQPLLDAHWESLGDVVTERLTTVAQIALIRLAPVGETEGALLLVANTHLFFHPHAQHIRIMQAATIMTRLTQLQEQVLQSHGHRPRLMFCGDLNSTPGTATVRFLSGEPVEPTDSVWRWLDQFEW
jgi:2',5'-phosphodiesterase